jgi:hypothetical protein
MEALEEAALPGVSSKRSFAAFQILLNLAFSCDTGRRIRITLSRPDYVDRSNQPKQALSTV